MAIATFGLTPAGLAVVEEMALMVVSENWIPYESVYEKKLVDALAKLNGAKRERLALQLAAGQADRGCDPAASRPRQSRSMSFRLQQIAPTRTRLRS